VAPPVPATPPSTAIAPTAPAPTAPSPTAPSQAAADGDGALSLVTEPGDDYQSVDQLVSGARHSIDLTMYELADERFEGLLVAAHQRGVSVRVLLDHAYGGADVNQAAVARLSAAGVPVRWAPDTIIFHQKTLTADDAVSAVMTGNLTARYYPSTRDFVVLDRDPAAVAAIESVFAEDWSGTLVTGGPTVAGLVWSPGSGPALVGLIGSAQRSIVVENEEMDSATIEAALEAASRRGVDVEVIMTTDSAWDGALAALADAGVRVATYPDSSSALYIHAKVIVVDGVTAFVGSQNFSASSLDDNRELGVITTDPTVVTPVSETLAQDLAGAVTVSASVTNARWPSRSWPGGDGGVQSTSRMASAALTLRPGPGSTFSTLTTPSSMTMA
jgi:phosphatidylserine/phosphatidylglycerophosphate/cardiolipin synthase-like enzyme